MPDQGGSDGPDRIRVPAVRVFWTFLQLGLTSFGGPIAHIGYFRRELAERRRWLTTQSFDELAALCQFLPGPASSQMGFAIGLRLAGWRGGLAAFLGFTAPSALLMLTAAALAVGNDPAHIAPLSHGLQLVAVAVVGQAVIAMARTQLRDALRWAIGAFALILVLSVHWPGAPPAVILLASIFGAVMPTKSVPIVSTPPARRRNGAFIAFALLLICLPLGARLIDTPELRIADGFYRSGALVFGGGHVVLPLLQAESASWLPADRFLAGYGFAQALPGPLFAFAAYLGALAGPHPPDAWLGLIALLSLFLPGFLLVAAADPLWARLRASARAQGVVRMASAAVVGVLAAAWITPVASSALSSPLDAAIAIGGLTALLWPATPILPVIVLVALAGMGVSLLGA